MIKHPKLRLAIRYLVKLLLPMLGFQNLLLIFEKKISEQDTLAETDDQFVYKTLRYPFSLEGFEIDCGDLRILKDEFSKDSVLAIALLKQRIIGYMWAHYDFDPLHEIKTDLNSFVVIGPSFVLPSFRGKNISKSLRIMLLKEAYEENYSTIISKTAFDNIPQIKSSIKVGYKIHRVMYKIKNKSYYL